MEKNILVIDEFGKKLHSTWPKRAKQLVKKERAYYIDKHTICLINQKEENMSKELYSDILEKIDHMTKELEDLNKIVETIHNKNLSSKQIKATRKLVKDREKTYRKTIKQLRKIYDDQSGRALRKSILKTARIAAKNGEAIDEEKLLSELEATRK